MRPTMSCTATIIDSGHDHAPWWESFGHGDTQAAIQAARAHIDATRPGDRIDGGDGHGVHAIFAGPTSETRVATLVIAATDDEDDDVSTTPTAPPTR